MLRSMAACQEQTLEEAYNVQKNYSVCIYYLSRILTTRSIVIFEVLYSCMLILA